LLLVTLVVPPVVMVAVVDVRSGGAFGSFLSAACSLSVNCLLLPPSIPIMSVPVMLANGFTALFMSVGK
jgi:hypothetical protein